MVTKLFKKQVNWVICFKVCTDPYFVASSSNSSLTVQLGTIYYATDKGRFLHLCRLHSAGLCFVISVWKFTVLQKAKIYQCEWVCAFSAHSNSVWPPHPQLLPAASARAAGRSRAAMNYGYIELNENIGHPAPQMKDA